MNSPLKDTEQFQRQAQQVCEVYAQAPALHNAGVHLISLDEKSGIQALQRKYPTQPASPGKLELREFEHVRHGTVCLMANFEVATARGIMPSLGPTRTEEDFVAHVAQTVVTDPTGEWVFVVDNLNTHVSASLVRWVARVCEIEMDVGEKGKRGVLRSQLTRRAFLSDPSHRIRLLYTPRHASWLNQVEIWFSVLARRLLRRGSFTSVDHLRRRILRFIDYFNATLAKPCKWTHTGRPLRAA